MDENERRPYEEKAVADKKRYEEQKANYLVSFFLFILTAILYISWYIYANATQAGEEEEESS